MALRYALPPSLLDVLSVTVPRGFRLAIGYRCGWASPPRYTGVLVNVEPLPAAATMVRWMTMPSMLSARAHQTRRWLTELVYRHQFEPIIQTRRSGDGQPRYQVDPSCSVVGSATPTIAVQSGRPGRADDVHRGRRPIGLVVPDDRSSKWCDPF